MQQVEVTRELEGGALIEVAGEAFLAQDLADQLIGFRDRSRRALQEPHLDAIPLAARIVHVADG